MLRSHRESIRIPLVLEGDEWIGRLGSGGGPHSLIGEEEIYLERGDPKALVDHRYATEVEGKEKRVCSREREREKGGWKGS